MASKLAVPLLYKGAGPGTHWHRHDAVQIGFSPPLVAGAGVQSIVSHIVHGSSLSACTSFTTSYAVALSYALSGPGGTASRSHPGYVYVVDLSQLPGSVMPTLLDPVLEIARGTYGGFAHRHNGEQALLHEICDSKHPYSSPRKRFGGTTAASVTAELTGLVWALRDAEVLLHGPLAKAAISRDSVYP